jgi:hypothetical protein
MNTLYKAQGFAEISWHHADTDKLIYLLWRHIEDGIHITIINFRFTIHECPYPAENFVRLKKCLLHSNIDM